MKNIFKILVLTLLCTNVYAQSPNVLPSSRINGSFTVDSVTVMHDTLKVDNQLQVKGGMTVDSVVVVKDTLRSQGDISGEKDLKINGNVIIGGDLNLRNTTNKFMPLLIDPTGKVSAGIPPVCNSAMANIYWNNMGNFGTNPITTGGGDFVGTCDAIDFVIGTNGLPRITTLQNGNVGIGTTTPSNLFEVNGNSRFFGDVVVSSLLGTGNRALNVDANGKIIVGALTTSGGAWNLGGNSFTGGATLGTTDASDLPIITNGIERLKITASGLVVLNDNNILLRGSGDPSHGIGYHLNYAGASIDGPVIYGYSGGALGSNQTVVGGAFNIALRWFHDGRVGIGTIEPKETFQIGDRFTFHSGGSKYIGYNSYYDNTTFTNKRIVNDYASTIAMGGGEIVFSVAPNNGAGTDINFSRGITIKNDGNVYIGDKKPTNAPYSNSKLSVDGTITAKEIYVADQVHAGWADYVFEKEYNLKKLNEVEQYIKKEKHLPNVPSAKEVEENGQALGKLQVIQMEKIEEIYLYLIEQNKKIEALQKELTQLKQQQ